MRKKSLKELAAQVHKLKPIVIVGNKGLTTSVQAEIDQALAHHELIKIKLASGDYDQRTEIIEEICTAQGAECIKRIGRMAAMYRKKKPQ